MRPSLKFILIFLILTSQSCQTQPQLQNKSIATTEFLPTEKFYNLMQQARVYQGYGKLQQQRECDRLKQIYKTTGTWQIQWLLVYALNNEFSCYNVEQTIEILAALELAMAPDIPLHGLNKNQIKLHTELHKLEKKTKSLRWKLKSSQKKLKKANAKLEALKAIETSINKKLDEEKTTP